MVKAYTAAVQAAFEQLPRSRRVAWTELRACLDYALLAPLERRIADFEGEILATGYAERVELTLHLPAERAEEFSRVFADLTAGRGTLVSVGHNARVADR